MLNRLSTLFTSKPLLDRSSADWIIESFGWALTHFDSTSFFNQTQLIQPTNRYFPGAVNSVHSKAENIFNHTLHHCGLNQWPFKLVQPQFYLPEPPKVLGISGHKRYSPPFAIDADNQANSQSTPEGTSEVNFDSNSDSNFGQSDQLQVNHLQDPSSQLKNSVIAISYDPNQTLKAGDLASTFAHILAQHVTVQALQLPPGGRDFFMEGTELLAIFMGFGVLFANSAYTFRGGCGSCYNPYANRQASLSENDVLFALAVFCKLKGIDLNTASTHLKSHLKKPLKSAFKQLNHYQTELDQLIVQFRPNKG